MPLFVLTKKSINASAFQLNLIFLLFYMYKYTYLCNLQELNIISCLKKNISACWTGIRVTPPSHLPEFVDRTQARDHTILTTHKVTPTGHEGNCTEG